MLIDTAIVFDSSSLKILVSLKCKTFYLKPMLTARTRDLGALRLGPAQPSAKSSDIKEARINP